MGVLFSNGFAIGTNPKPMNVNVHDWIIYSNAYVPAYNSGWITIPNHSNSTNLNDLNLVPTDPNIGLYINVSNTAGFEQLGNLIGLVGNYTRVSFTWGTSDFITFDCTPDAFKLVDIGGGDLNIIYDQTYIGTPSGPNSISIYDTSNTSYLGGPIKIAYTITSAQGAFGILGRWLLATESFGCQPAWDDGVFNLIEIPYACNGQSNFYDIFNQHHWTLFISGKDSTGHDQSSYLAQAIGYGGTITFTQGASYVTLSFDSSNAEANTYSSVDGLILNEANTIITGWNVGTFNGFNNAGHTTNNIGGPNEQYFVQPLNTQLVEITLNVNVVTPTPSPTPNTTPTPSPTPNTTPNPSETPTPTPTQTPTPGPTLYSFNISGWYANDIDACSGNANITAYSTNNSYPQMGDIIYTDNTGTTTYGAGFYLTVYGNTIELDSSGVIIGGPNSC